MCYFGSENVTKKNFFGQAYLRYSSSKSYINVGESPNPPLFYLCYMAFLQRQKTGESADYLDYMKKGG